jgi:hypothetical protein
MSPMARLYAALALVLAGELAYSNSFRVPFLFDDFLHIGGGTAANALWPPWTYAWSATRPVGSYSFALNYAIHRSDVWGYHAVNLAIHLAGGVVLWGIVRRWLSTGALAARYGRAADHLALAAAAIWMLHPLQTESVTYIYQRFESLMGLFFMLALYAFIRAQESPRAWLWYGSSVVACFLAIGCKESAAVAPLVIAWYDRVMIAPSWGDLLRRRGWYYALTAGVPLCLALSLALTTHRYLSGGAMMVDGITPWSYAQTQPGVILHYLRLCFWPQGLCFYHGWPIAHSLLEVVPPGLLVVGLLVTTAWAAWHSPEMSFWGGWFFLILAPTSSFLPIRDVAVEHRMYLPLASVVVLVVLAGWEALRYFFPLAWHATLGTLFTVAIAAGLGLTTYQRNLVYANELTLFRDVVEKSPRGFRGLTNYAVLVADQGRYAEARDLLTRALAIDPNYDSARKNLDIVEGILRARQAVRRGPAFHNKSQGEMPP